MESVLSVSNASVVPCRTLCEPGEALADAEFGAGGEGRRALRGEAAVLAEDFVRPFRSKSVEDRLEIRLQGSSANASFPCATIEDVRQRLEEVSISSEQVIKSATGGATRFKPQELPEVLKWFHHVLRAQQGFQFPAPQTQKSSQWTAAVFAGWLCFGFRLDVSDVWLMRLPGYIWSRLV
jgi:hypothetical protein